MLRPSGDGVLLAGLEVAGMTDQGSSELGAGRLRRWWRQLVAAGRWAFDVLRGFAWSRHLDQREK